MSPFRLFGAKPSKPKSRSSPAKSTRVGRRAPSRSGTPAKGTPSKGAAAIRAAAEAPPKIDLSLDRAGLIKQALKLHRHHNLAPLVNPQRAVDDYNHLSRDVGGSAFGPDQKGAFQRMVALAASRKKLTDLNDDDTGTHLAAVVLRQMLIGGPME